MTKVSAYIDALNLYHSLKENSWQKYYWLNIPDLLKRFLRDGETLETIYYFTSMAKDSDRRKRQTTYIEALETTALYNLINFKVIRGRFEEEDIICNFCNDFAFCKNCENLLSFTHEKETDVNISVQMLSDAYEEEFDTAFLITADSDQVGAIRTIKKLFYSSKQVGVILPPGRESINLKRAADFYLHIDQSSLGKSQLPEKITKPGGFSLVRPENWK